MKTYPIKDDNGRHLAFEIDNMDVWMRRITTLLSEVEGVTEIRKKWFFRGASEIHVDFKYNDTDFVVWEPYGDSSRYRICPKDDKGIGMDVTGIELVFQRFNQPVTPNVMIWTGFLAILLMIAVSGFIK